MSEPTANAEEPPTNTGSKVAMVILLAVFVIAMYKGISEANIERREDELDRQMLRQMYAKMFGKNDFLIKSFAQDILELIGKF